MAFHFYAINRKEIDGLEFTLFEMQKELSELSKKTAQVNGFENFTIKNCKLQEISKTYRESFSLVLCNPPYERAGSGFDNDEYHKAVCRKELTLTLQEIAKAANFALKFGGRICMLHRADRLPEVCYHLKAENIEVKKIQFVGGKDATKPYLVMVEGVKGGKPGCTILETIVNARE